MKVLHISTLQEGGAALCAQRINNALTFKGVESRMLFAIGKQLPQGIHGEIANKDRCLWINIPFIKGIVWRIMRYTPFGMNIYKFQGLVNDANPDHLDLHIPLSQFINIAKHPLVEWADIIHLHWVCSFVDYPTFFKNIKKPIIWTLHDKYPALGLFHYSSVFFPVSKKLKKLDEYCKKVKRDGVSQCSNLYLVAISEYTKTVCENSSVLKGFPITYIPNGVDSEIFYYRVPSKNEFKVDQSTIVFMFSAFNVWDYNKGLKRVIEALEIVKSERKASILLLIVGNIVDGNIVPVASFPIKHVGFINDQEQLACLYSQADFFLCSSYEETFSQTILESLACGTPVVTTPCGGTECISSLNGYVCDGFSPDSIAKGIFKTIDRDYDRKKIRKDVLSRYSYSKIADQYFNLYKKVL